MAASHLALYTPLTVLTHYIYSKNKAWVHFLKWTQLNYRTLERLTFTLSFFEDIFHCLFWTLPRKWYDSIAHLRHGAYRRHHRRPEPSLRSTLTHHNVNSPQAVWLLFHKNKRLGFFRNGLETHKYLVQISKLAKNTYAHNHLSPTRKISFPKPPSPFSPLFACYKTHAVRSHWFSTHKKWYNAWIEGNMFVHLQENTDKTLHKWDKISDTSTNKKDQAEKMSGKRHSTFSQAQNCWAYQKQFSK